MRPELHGHTRLPTLSVTAASIMAAIALAVAMGIGRFAFTPLLPLMVRDGSLPQKAGAWLAASNYLGYLAGALTASRLGCAQPTLMRVGLVGTAVSTAAMGALGGLAAWIILRCIAGVFSAWTLVATSAWALEQLARAGRADLAGMVYAGVGLGIAFAGLFCLAAGRPGVPASQLWLELGAAAALAILAPSYLVERPTAAVSASVGTRAPERTAPASTGLVICYGVLGFGYILPATFLPALAREIVDNPRLFGLAWPVFGMAAAVSTFATAWHFHHRSSLRVWAISHGLMAVGVVLPSISLEPATLAMAALLVGSTFMVATMIGMQEARARAAGNPAQLLGRMTAAFAIGQLAGPLVSGTIDLLSVASRAALSCALEIAAFALALSAAYLWSQSHGGSSLGESR